MAVAVARDASIEPSPEYDRLQELKAFDESKAGVKGLVDAGIEKIPRMFVRPNDELAGDYPISDTHLIIPVIDLRFAANRQSTIVNGVLQASEKLGFFQVVNHGIPTSVLEEMLRAARGFHELPKEVKMELYTRELERRVKFGSNFDLYQSRSANWRDTLFCVMGPDPLDPQELPEVCRDITKEYSKQIKRLGMTLFELLSEALGLKPDHLIGLDCAKGHAILSHYYPACPEPELTMGTTKHSDPDFLTILLQDDIGGLQILHQNQWVNVPPVHGALVVNIGDLLQGTNNGYMDISGTKESSAESAVDFDRARELKDFDDSKAGVNGLIDAGVEKVPKIFIRPPDELAEELNTCQTYSKVPVIDLSGTGKSDRRKEVVQEVQIASEEWGVFQVVNHGIPLSVLDEMIHRICMFHEQVPEVKKAFYTRDLRKQVRFGSNIDLYQSRAANWRDTLSISMRVSDHLDPDEVPTVCRAATIEYIKYVTKLGEALFELLSEALGLKSDHLTSMECARERNFACHYYPACPEPELTLGTSKHSDVGFITTLLQDQLGGLQVKHENQWVNVQPIAGGFVVFIGELLQIISNDKFKSAVHRVLANHVGPRISVASFFNGVSVPPKLYGPIKELTSEENPPLYKEFLVSDYTGKFYSRALDQSHLGHFKL